MYRIYWFITRFSLQALQPCFDWDLNFVFNEKQAFFEERFKISMECVSQKTWLTHGLSASALICPWMIPLSRFSFALLWLDHCFFELRWVCLLDIMFLLYHCFKWSSFTLAMSLLFSLLKSKKQVFVAIFIEIYALILKSTNCELRWCFVARSHELCKREPLHRNKHCSSLIE